MDNMTSFIPAMLWFDTEDFITHESDEILLSITRMLEKHEIKATFKIVGERLRVLEKRGRFDIIEELSKHNIGYHSDLHSVHPTISEYVGGLSWDDGVSEFETREQQGIETVRRFFKDISCFGHPGLCWVPQAYPVLTKWGIQVYLDETYALANQERRPYYYCNILNIMGLGELKLSIDASGGPGNLPLDNLTRTAPDRFTEAYNELTSSPLPGVISILSHPSTYVTEEFWDKVNYSAGKNPSNTKVPRLKPRELVQKHLEDLDKFLGFAKSFKNIRFITATEAGRLFTDHAPTIEFTDQDLYELCRKSINAINHYRSRSEWLSPAEIFSMVITAIATYRQNGHLPSRIKCLQPLGPKENSISKLKSAQITSKSLLECCDKTLLHGFSYLPSKFIGEEFELSTADMFSTLCYLYTEMFATHALPPEVPLHSGNFTVGTSISELGFQKNWDLTYTNPSRFFASNQITLARLQAWTLKPAHAAFEAA